MHKGKDAGIARLLKRDAISQAGMGILVDRRRIITCAHVVNAALGPRPKPAEKPNGEINVSFPLASDSNRIFAAHVVGWAPVGGDPEDIAVLQLREDAPAEVGYALLTHFEASLEHHPLTIFGMPHGDPRHVDVKYQGLTASVEVQVDGQGNAGEFVEGGFSGAGVWDSTQQAFIGMVRSIAVGGRRMAYLTPVGAMLAVCPSLPIERRQLSATFLRTWTASAVAFIAVTFYLFGSNLWWTKLSHPQLAAFGGMHIYPFLGALIAWLLLSHARSYMFHPWSTRVPKLAGLRFDSGSIGEKRGAFVMLLVLMIFPLYAQIHFMKEFHNEGYVYIYPRDFGYKARELQSMIADGVACLSGQIDSGNIKCRHPDARRYGTVEPRPGAPGGYWYNRYHYGDIRSRGNESANFYPILQPVAIIVLSILTLALNVWALQYVFGNHRERLLRRTPSKSVLQAFINRHRSRRLPGHTGPSA